MLFKEALLQELVRRNIKYVYGVPGRENEHILFNEVDGIEYITTRVEFTAGIMADFAGRLTDQPQACFTTMGPGATNVTTAVASAMLNKSPVIFFTSQLESNDIFYNITHQCVDQASILAPLTKWSYELRHPQELYNAVDKAFEIALTEPVGPVHISIPVDFYNQEIISPPGREAIKLTETIRVNAKPASEWEIDTIMEKVQGSSRPLCLIGQEVIRVGADKELIEFCRHYNIPFVTAANAKGVAPFDDPLNYGAVSCYMEGILGYPALDDIFVSADLIICVGYQYVDDLLPKMWTRGNEKTVISLGSSPQFMIHSKFNPDLECVCDLKHLFTTLTERNGTKKDPRDLIQMKQQYEKVLNAPQKDQNYFSPGQVMNIINRYLGSGYLITDIGYYRHHAIMFSTPASTKKFFSDTGLSSFGTGLPSAAAAQLLNPGEKVFLICGDGGFHSGSGDLATLTKYGLPVVVVVLNNASYELINLYQQRSKTGRNPEIVRLESVDFVKLAEANGCNGVRVSTLEQLDAAIAGNDYTKPLVIEVPVDYQDDFVISF
ncbi:thiamine pyrophosphate-binding protein [Paenibacillus xylaniclasticus]|uniref:thiamine pyrophosphate-binding protein n=1 Tax=Paenibacillus xylaniclasticus TaxID=588083 RepID=UPI000FDAE73D|nr:MULTISPECIES: thiamine pyrophosphate-binding protein [Paenibacillus]GFN33203.1 acetolactate synthase [Paenibacillus curdlanolyticus]